MAKKKEKEIEAKENEVKIEKIKVEEIKEETPVVKELVIEETQKCACKKRKRFGLGFLFGLIVGVLSCIGILLWHGYTKEETDTSKCNIPSEAEDKKTEPEKNELTNDFKIDSAEVKTIMKQLPIYDDLSYFYFDLGKEEITNQDLLYFALKQIGFVEAFSLEDVEKIISTYFELSVKPENIACRKNFHKKTEYLYIYDAKNKKFIYNENHGGHGGGHISPYKIYNRFVSFKENTYDTKELLYPEYELVVYRAYSSLAEDTGIGELAYYSSYKDAYEEKNPLFEIEYDGNFYDDFKPITDIEKELDALEEKVLSKETFTFIKKGDNFLLTKYTID